MALMIYNFGKGHPVWSAVFTRVGEKARKPTARKERKGNV
jgi:hypothetical protein